MSANHPSQPSPQGFSPILWRVVLWIVPPEARGRFRREWTAELAHLEARSGERPRRGAARRAALADAWWLRRNRGAVPPFSARLIDAGPLPGDAPIRGGAGPLAPGALWTRCGLVVRVCRRRLLRSPLFGALFVLLLGGGVAAATTVYTVAHRVIFTPLDYQESDRLVRLLLRDPDGKLDWTSWATYERLAAAEVFEAVSASTTFPGTWRSPEGRERIQRAFVSSEYFETLGVGAALGTWFDAGTDVEDQVVLSDGFWRGRLSADEEIVGRRIEVDGRVRLVVGVAPAGLYGHDLGNGAPQLYLVQPASQSSSSPHFRVYTLVARLRAGQSPELAAAELARVTRSLAEERPDLYGGWTPEAEPLLASLLEHVDRSLRLLLSAVVALLMIVALNLAGLMAARALSRERESALHRAIGAGRGAAAVHGLVEAVVLSLLGGAFGVAVSAGALQAIAAFDPTLPRLHEVAWGAPALLFAGIATAGATLVVLVATVALSRSRQPFLALREGSRSGASRRPALRGLVISGQVALAVPLALGACLLLGSLFDARGRDLGIDVADVHAVRISRPPERSRDLLDNALFFDQVLERVRALPGARYAGAGLYAPLVTEEADRTRFEVRGAPPRADEEAPRALMQIASDGFFETLDTRVVEGRAFDARDRLDAPPVAVVNRELVRRVFAEGSPLGERLEIELSLIPGQPRVREIVGVVEDQAQLGPLAEIEPMIYLPHGQAPWPSMALVVRSPLPLASLQPPLRATVLELDPEAIVDPAVTLTSALEGTLTGSRGLARLLTVFAAAAVMVTALGLYSTLSLQVTERRREIGLRMALGATRSDVARLFLRRGATMTLAGLAPGILLAVGFHRVLASRLHGASDLDPVAAAATLGVLVCAGLLAAWGPARRAARHDPAGALRR